MHLSTEFSFEIPIRKCHCRGSHKIEGRDCLRKSRDVVAAPSKVVVALIDNF